MALGGLMMKLKVLPPTLRKNNRYLVVEIKITSPIVKDELVSIVWDACVRFQGELNSANFNLWVMRFYEMDKTEEYYAYKAIIRCQRGYVDEVRSSLVLANKYNNNRISITTVYLSGTIKAAKRYI